MKDLVASNGPSAVSRVLLCLSFVLIALAGCRPPVLAPLSLGPRHRFRPTAKAVISSPLVWDLTGDGQPEIAVGSWDGYFYVLDVLLNDQPGWPQYSPNGFFSSPALADLTQDGRMAVVAGAESGLLYAWYGDGQSVPGFPVDLGYRIWASPLVLPDGCLAIGSLNVMTVWTQDARPAPGWPQPMAGWSDATGATNGTHLAVTTLTPGDPSEGWAYMWQLNGDLMPGYPVRLTMDSDSSPAMVVLEDLPLSMVFGDDAGYLHVLDSSGRAWPGFPQRSLGPGQGPTPTPHPPGGNIHSIESSPAVGDLDNDGWPEIAVGSWDAHMYVWRMDGTAMPGWPVRVPDQIISSAALVDLTDDGCLDVVVGCKDGKLYGWTHQGVPLAGFPHDLGASVFSSPWIGDLDADGRADIVVGANNGIHVLYDVGPLGRADWPMFHRNESRTGCWP